ncbi:hypothetical protein [Aquabacterium sp.]|uniref:hypothetical protein n=1 Tax=Aquabacterium sp. TaxID=1872578 RepID=UPI002488B3B8|nr:hypothetical protein [Aquabacterium sp.]MDI1258145.1 hypothetical protein [Aquabacterium sp.]
MNLQELLPEAIAWAKTQAQHVANHGHALSAPGLELAHQVGVKNPELVRLLYVDQLPIPVEPPRLRQAALDTGMLRPDMVGLTLGHSIFIVHGHDDARLISHELRHVRQYETLGGIEGFMPIYLAQMGGVGYELAPLEQDARAHEVRGPRNQWT